MDPATNVLNGRSFTHADRVGKIRMGTSLFRINFHEVEVGPYAIDKIAQIKVHLATDDDCMVFVSQAIHRLEADGVYLVVDIWQSYA